MVTRSELFQLVWSFPKTKVGERLGVSGNTITKTCRKYNIPTPKAGYWALDISARKKVPTPAFRHRSPGMSDEISFRGRYDHVSSISDSELLATEIRRPEIDRSLEDYRHEIEQSLPKVRAPKSLGNPHREIQKLLAADE
jgi:hypothetical protein